jgi:hypothetical protein
MGIFGMRWQMFFLLFSYSAQVLDFQSKIIISRPICPAHRSDLNQIDTVDHVEIHIYVAISV